VDIYDPLKAQVFISYARYDQPLVANLVDRLKDEAIAAAAVLWYDPDLTPGREWDEEIMTRLHEADVILVLASPKFFQSHYCTERELPAIRQRANGLVQQSTFLSEQPLTHTPVRVIRLRDFDEPRSEIEGLDIWPDADRTLEVIAPDGPEIRELRTWLKVEICKALVRRHADCYHHRSREEEIKRRNENQDSSARSDDLSFLHHELGVPVPKKVRGESAYPFRRKQLKVFTDVRHLYQPPVVEPLPPPVRNESYLMDEPDSPVVENELGTEVEAEEEPEVENSRFHPKTPEDVTPNLTVVASAARPEETSQLLASLQADYCDDVYQISVVVDTDSQASNPEYWTNALANEGRCVVLMTTELLQTPIPEAVAEALACISSLNGPEYIRCWSMSICRALLR
jgi:hypothetical protein